MKIFVKAKLRVKQEWAEKIDNTHFVVAVKEIPTGGRANEAIIKALAEYFDVARSSVRIIAGHLAKQKRVEIDH